MLIVLCELVSIAYFSMLNKKHKKVEIEYKNKNHLKFSMAVTTELIITITKRTHNNMNGQVKPQVFRNNSQKSIIFLECC